MSSQDSIAPTPGRTWREALLVAGVYAAIALVYIVVSDRLVAALLADPDARLAAETAKGAAFVLVTAAGLFVTWTVLSRRERRERERHIATLRRLGDLGDVMPNPLIVLSPEGRLLEWNAALETVTGHDSERLRDITVAGLAHPDDLEAARQAIARVITTGRSEGTDVRLMTAGGDGLYYRWRGGAVHDADGRLAGVAVVGLDMTDLRQTQERLSQSLLAAKRVLRQTVDVLTLAAEKRDPFTAGHEQRVASLSLAIADELGVPADEREGLEYAALLHDIGKIAIPAEILTKPGPLSGGEYALVKTHVAHGFDILKSVAFPWPVAEIVGQHHERLDGTGYPQGLRGDAIRREARIIAVADVVEAMCSHRPYRAALGLDAALAELQAGEGSSYDDEAVAACARVFERGYVLPAMAG